MATKTSKGPKCYRCGGTLERPEPGAQFECGGCGLVVAPDNLKQG